MNYSERLRKCSDFISKWNHFLELEPIRKYPNHIPNEIKSWVKEISTYGLQDLVDLENKRDTNTNNQEFSEFLCEIRNLTEFQSLEIKEDKHKLISKKLKQKKQHEISQICNAINQLDNIEVIDIGGGTGQLSENIINDRDRFSFCIDSNLKFQKSGIDRINQNQSKNLKKIKFINNKFNAGFSNTEIESKSNKLILGLHACGDLSSDIIEYFHKTKSKYLINVGCCYQKITNKYNLSRNANIKLTTNSFNLAARSHVLQSLKGLKQKIKVRTYRYGLHLYLYELGHTKFHAIGKTSLADYDMPFSDYAEKYCDDLIGSKFTAQNFFDSPKTQGLISEIIHTDIIRGLMGRVIESYIIVDRALYLHEKKHSVSVKEIFDRKYGPRNLAIMANI